MKNDYNNPLAVVLPYQFNSPDDYPTEVLANRFHAWRYIIKDIVSYLREYASVQEEIVRQQIRLQQAVGISANSIAVAHGSSNGGHGHSGGHSGGHSHSGHGHSNSINKDVDVNEIDNFFLPIGNGSIQDLPTILTKFHQQNVNSTSKTSKELNTVIIPKLEELRKDLLIKIKEIKNLQNDFKNNLGKEIAETKNLLNQYYQAIDLSNKLEHGINSVSTGDSNDHYKYDPYLVKIKLDRQLKRQLQEENYLYQAYQNLQESGGKLESIIVIELQNYLSNFLNLISNEYSAIPNYLLPNLNNGFLAKEATFEWDSFIAKNLPSPGISINAVGNSNSSIKNGTFIDLKSTARKFSDLSIKNYNTPLNLAVREGNLERRSKFLKNYSSGWYVLTCNYIHEFKTSDRKKDQAPILSIPLDSCQVSDHSKNDGKTGGAYKFILNSKLSNGIMHRNQNWVFRTDTYQSMIEWYNDIKALTSLATPAARSRYIAKKFKIDPNQVNPNLVRVQSKQSRTSSVVSAADTNAKSIRSIDTTQTNQNRLSATLSNSGKSANISNNSKSNLHSPRLNHLINSDGTILTPIVTNERKSKSGSPNSTSTPQQYYYQPQNMQHQMSQNLQIPTTTIQHPTPQQPSATPQLQQPMVLPPNFIPNFQQGYYIANGNGGQVQQFYDPIQQQYYTIAQQPPAQGPQPQYFPTSPQPQTQSQFRSASPNQQGYFYIQPKASQPQDYGFGGQLPYPANHADVYVPPEVRGEAGQESHHDTSSHESHHDEVTEENTRSNDTVTDTTEDTLKNGHEELKNGDLKKEEHELSKKVSQLSV